MKKHIFTVGLLFALAGCDIGGIRGNGQVVSEQRNVDPFVNVETGGAFRVEWNSGAPSASITVDENLMQYVEMEVRDKVLHVRTTRSVRPTPKELTPGNSEPFAGVQAAYAFCVGTISVPRLPKMADATANHVGDRCECVCVFGWRATSVNRHHA